MDLPHTELNLPRYKYMVQCVIGEQRGEGARFVNLGADPGVSSLFLPRLAIQGLAPSSQRRASSFFPRRGCRTFWDRDTDTYASDTFINDSIFCVVVAYAVYLS